MPLIKSKSKKAFVKNMATEVAAKEVEGVPSEKAQKIAAAIAYAEKRQAGRKGKK